MKNIADSFGLGNQSNNNNSNTTTPIINTPNPTTITSAYTIPVYPMPRPVYPEPSRPPPPPPSSSSSIVSTKETDNDDIDDEDDDDYDSFDEEENHTNNSSSQSLSEQQQQQKHKKESISRPKNGLTAVQAAANRLQAEASSQSTSLVTSSPSSSSSSLSRLKRFTVLKKQQTLLAEYGYLGKIPIGASGSGESGDQQTTTLSDVKWERCYLVLYDDLSLAVFANQSVINYYLFNKGFSMYQKFLYIFQLWRV